MKIFYKNIKKKFLLLNSTNRNKPNTLDKDSYFIPAGYDSLTLLKGSDISNDLSKLYEDRIQTPKQKNILKEQEVQCEDISIFLNAWRDNRKVLYQSNATDYASNPSLNGIDEKGKKKLDLLQGIRKQDYSSNANGTSNDENSIRSNNYESTDIKSKVDFQKFLGMNANKNINANDAYSTNYQRTSNKSSAASALNSLKTKNPEIIKVLVMIIIYNFYFLINFNLGLLVRLFIFEVLI